VSAPPYAYCGDTYGERPCCEVNSLRAERDALRERVAEATKIIQRDHGMIVGLRAEVERQKRRPCCCNLPYGDPRIGDHDL